MSTPKNSNANDCITSCCVFNYYTQSPVYNPNPTRLWSRFNYVCPCSPDQPSCSTDYDKLDERRKAEIFKYKANSSNITKKQQYANAASNRWLTGRKQGWATQTDTFTNPNTSTLKQVGNVLECTNNNVSSSLTSDSDVPGKVQKLSYNTSVPLYNYKVTRTYTDGGGKYGLYGRVENPSLSNFNNITTTVNEGSFNLTPPTSNSAGAFTYTSSNLLVATISGITVTAISVGFCTITATQAAYSNYRPGSIQAQLTVKEPPTITFALPSLTYGDAPFTVTPATSNSSGAFSYSSSDTSVATISVSGEIVKIAIFAKGTVVITAAQAADSKYSSGTLPVTLNVLPAPFTATWQYTTDEVNFIDLIKDEKFPYIASSSYTISVKGKNPPDATFSQSGNPSINNVNDAAAQLELTGKDNYQGSIKSYSINLTPIPPNITFTFPSLKKYGDAPFTVTPATSNSSGTFTYKSSDSSGSDSSVATISVSGEIVTITILAAGESSITALQLADGNYSSGTSSPVNLIVNKIAPTISIDLPTNINTNTKPFSLNPFTKSDNQSSPFVYTSGDTLVATISEDMITIKAEGTSDIKASQVETQNYFAGESPATPLTVSLSPPIQNILTPSNNFSSSDYTIQYFVTPGSESASYTVYTFLSNSGHVTPNGVFDIDYLIIGGGGNGGAGSLESYESGNGGNAGQLITSFPTIPSSEVLPALKTVKNGDGSFVEISLSVGVQGSDSVFLYVASGGANGGYNNSKGGNGGSGAGGGGGDGDLNGGPGGPGLSSSIANDNNSVYYAGGGGGCGKHTRIIFGDGGSGGIGRGGQGQSMDSSGPGAQNGVNGFGSGGGGNHAGSTVGGSGVVILRFLSYQQ